MPGLVKVGFTERSPYERAVELSRATGVPGAFTVVWARQCLAPRSCEYEVHQALARYRVHKGREFFRCDVATAKAEIEKAADGFLRRTSRPPRSYRRESFMFGLWRHRSMLFEVSALVGIAWALKTGNMWRLASGAMHLLISLSYLGHHHY